MSNATGVHRTKMANGMEVAFVDKGMGTAPIGIPRDRYEAQGYEPPYENLPEK